MVEIVLETRDRFMFVIHQLEGGVAEAGQGVHFRRWDGSVTI